MKKYIITDEGEEVLVAGEVKDFRMPNIEMINLNTGETIKIYLDEIKEGDITQWKYIPWD